MDFKYLRPRLDGEHVYSVRDRDPLAGDSPMGNMTWWKTRSSIIYIAVARIALDATPAGGCRTGRPVSDGTIAWLQRE
jgi:hypothetical protein